MNELYEDEILKKLIGINEGYAVSNYGRIFSYIPKGGRKPRDTIQSILTPRPGANKYLRVYIRNSATNTRQDYYVHRLVAQYFLPEPSADKNCVNHKDHNRQNNHVNNLEWVSYKENNEDTFAVGNVIRDKLTGRFVSNM